MTSRRHGREGPFKDELEMIQFVKNHTDILPGVKNHLSQNSTSTPTNHVRKATNEATVLSGTLYMKK
jgi:hypothetical protein